MIETVSRWYRICGRWHNPLGVLVIGVAAWIYLPGLLPLVVFGLLISLLGEGLVGFTLSIAGGVTVSILYPIVYGTESYNAGKGSIGFTDLIMSPMDSVIVGLLLLNAFFLLAFKNRYFQTYALPMIRSRLRTARGRLGWGWALAFVNFCDDLAAGGILNRLYENDIKSPGVSESIKRRMLIMVLLLANAFPALIPCSSWTAFYRKVDGDFHAGQFLYILLPLTLIFYCVWMVLFCSPSKASAQTKARRTVIGVDFLRERNPPDPGMSPVTFCVVIGFPFLLTLELLILCSFYQMNDALLFSFGIGLLLQIVTLTGLGVFEHCWRIGATPMVASPDLEAAEEGIAKVARTLRHERYRLLTGPHQMDSPSVCNESSAAISVLDTSIRSASEVGAQLVRMPEVQERLHPAMKPKSPFCHGLEAFWKAQPDKLLGDGITEMVSSLLRVYLILVLASATSVCLGVPLGKGQDKVANMLNGEGKMFGGLITDIRKMEAWWGVDVGILVVAILIVGLLLGLRHLRLSSAWGVLAMVYPLVGVILTALEVARPTNGPSLVHACFFGLIVSFGVWCNSTLPTGDNVTIAADIQDRDPDELARFSERINKWPLVFSAAGLFFALAFHRSLETWPGWLLWGVTPLLWAATFSGVSYWLNRKHLDPI